MRKYEGYIISDQLFSKCKLGVNLFLNQVLDLQISLFKRKWKWKKFLSLIFYGNKGSNSHYFYSLLHHFFQMQDDLKGLWIILSTPCANVDLVIKKLN